MTTTLLQIVAAFFGLLFLAAILAKLDTWSSWRRTVYRLTLRRQRLSHVGSFVIPALEGGAIALVFVHPTYGLAYCAALLLIFAVAIAFLASQEQEGENCGCLGAILPTKIGLDLAFRDLFLGIGAGLAAYGSWGQSVPPLEPLQVMLAMFLATVGLMLAAFRGMKQAAAVVLATREEASEL